MSMPSFLLAVRLFSCYNKRKRRDIKRSLKRNADAAKETPVGIENFEDIRKEPFYYADKTGLLVELLDSWGAVNLFTRPRRFGKTLNMSMLEHLSEACSARH